MADITATPQLLEQIRALIESGQINSLVDQRLVPSRQHENLFPEKFDPMHPKQSFFHVEHQVDQKPGTPYPRLLWSPTGVEITVKTEKDHKAKLEAGYLEASPVLNPETAEERAQREFEALNPEDQRLVLEFQEAHRRDRLNELAGQMAAPVKRGPGRPKKVANE